MTPEHGKLWRAASGKRLLLAVFLDFIIFSVIWGFAQMELYSVLPELKKLDFILKIAIFSLIEVTLLKAIKWAPGRHLLSISYLSAWSHREVEHSEDETPGRRIAVVDAAIKDHEAWYTILVGVLFLNDGLKSIVRWTMWSPPVPLFGYETTPLVSAVFQMIIGAVECYVAYSILKLKRRALPVGVTFILIGMVSTVMSWPLWDAWAGAMTHARRTYQGLPVKPGEVEFMQNIVPEALVVALVVYLALLVAIRKRLIYPRAAQTPR